MISPYYKVVILVVYR